MKFTLNKTSGINGIEKVSLEKIIQTFSVPENIEINIDKSNILDIGLKYEDINLAIFYVINFINSEITKNYITVHFVIKKLYLHENIFIEENEEINKDAGSGANRWSIGASNRKNGSIHSDYWEGTAADLATCNHIAVFPVIGWWRERHHLGKVENQTRYALIISLETPAQDVELYTTVKNLIEVPVEINTQ